MKYTIRQAVYDTLEAQPIGAEFKCRDFFDECRGRLHINGNPACPFDGTLQREMRRYRAVFKITCVDSHRSIYKIEERF